MDNLLRIAAILTLVAVGSSQNCQFVLRNGTGSDSTVCVRMNITAEFEIGYNKTVNNQTESTTATVPVDCNAVVAGYCSESIADDTYYSAAIEITWGDSQEYGLKYTLIANYDEREWNVSEIALSVNVDEFEDVIPEAGTITGTRNKDLIGHADFEKSYFCEKNKKFDFTLNTTDNNESVYFTMSAKISEFKVQAFEFKNSTTGEYQNSARCSQDVRGSTVVAIVIGTAVALEIATLIISLTIFYIIGCVKSHKKKSYQVIHE